MRDQYAGDLSDLLKFAFLRSMAAHDRSLGVAWYYDPGHDGRPDGRHLEWRDEPAWVDLDGDLHAGLATLPERSIAALEQAPIWPPGVTFHREPIPQRQARSAWGARKRQALDAADLVFLDPDNGLGGETQKHATFEEVRHLRRRGRTIVFITFPGRSMTHDNLVATLHAQLSGQANAERAVTLRTSVSVRRGPDSAAYVPRLRWFTMVDPDDVLIQRARQFATTLSGLPRVRATLHASN